jgi:peptidyl-tRNA hydrolase
MNPLDPEYLDPKNILACYLIVNGPLGMSAGKIASQSAQAMLSLTKIYSQQERAEYYQDYLKWLNNGTRTITRIAETPAVFERACNELPGITFFDQGLTEIEPGPTVHITYPLKRGSQFKMLRHKRCPLLSGPAIFNKYG